MGSPPFFMGFAPKTHGRSGVPLQRESVGGEVLARSPSCLEESFSFLKVICLRRGRRVLLGAAAPRSTPFQPPPTTPLGRAARRCPFVRLLRKASVRTLSSSLSRPVFLRGRAGTPRVPRTAVCGERALGQRSVERGVMRARWGSNAKGSRKAWRLVALGRCARGVKGGVGGELLARKLSCLASPFSFLKVFCLRRGRRVLLGAAAPRSTPFQPPPATPLGFPGGPCSLWLGRFLGRTDARHSALARPLRSSVR